MRLNVVLVGFVLIAIALSAPLFVAARGKAAPTTGTVQITYPLDVASLGVAGTLVIAAVVALRRRKR